MMNIVILHISLRAPLFEPVGIFFEMILSQPLAHLLERPVYMYLQVLVIQLMFIS